MSESNRPVRTRMKAAERRESILDAAELTFARLGYRGAGMADIAEASGVTQPMLYRHFASKQELFLAVLTRSGGEILAVWQDAPDLHTMGNAYAELANDRPHVARLRQMAMAESDEAIRTHMNSLFQAQITMIREKAAAAEAAGALAPGTTAQSVTWLFAALGMLIDATVALGVTDERSDPVEAAASLFFQLVTSPTYKGC